MKNGLFEIGDRVDHKTIGYFGAVVAVHPDGAVVTTSSLRRIPPVDLEMVNHAQIQHAFELGFKAAGGTVIPDGARNMIEFSLDREAVDELAAMAEASIPKSPGLRQFLESVNIHRSRK